MIGILILVWCFVRFLLYWQSCKECAILWMFLKSFSYGRHYKMSIYILRFVIVCIHVYFFVWIHVYILFLNRYLHVYLYGIQNKKQTWFNVLTTYCLLQEVNASHLEKNYSSGNNPQEIGCCPGLWLFIKILIWSENAKNGL